MHLRSLRLLIALAGIGDGHAALHAPVQGPTVVPLEDTRGLSLIRVRARAGVYRGRNAVELTSAPGTSANALATVALLNAPEFTDGTIDLWVAGTLAPDAAPDDRGFIGVVFRSSSDGSHSENIYLRPTNGRADDQLRRNHSTQYESLPDYPWYRLRKESPGMYESYVDLVPGEWTHIRVDVNGRRARLFVNDAAQPCMVITNLKLPTSHGKIGLWIGPGTRGYFSRMTITPRDTA